MSGPTFDHESSSLARDARESAQWSALLTELRPILARRIRRLRGPRRGCDLMTSDLASSSMVRLIEAMRRTGAVAERTHALRLAFTVARSVFIDAIRLQARRQRTLDAVRLARAADTVKPPSEAQNELPSSHEAADDRTDLDAVDRMLRGLSDDAPEAIPGRPSERSWGSNRPRYDNA
jgi:DNA-directed RNA polymerase specialized sigma24 family protein